MNWTLVDFIFFFFLSFDFLLILFLSNGQNYKSPTGSHCRCQRTRSAVNFTYEFSFVVFHLSSFATNYFNLLITSSILVLSACMQGPSSHLLQSFSNWMQMRCDRAPVAFACGRSANSVHITLVSSPHFAAQRLANDWSCIPNEICVLKQCTVQRDGSNKNKFAQRNYVLLLLLVPLPQLCCCLP